MAMVCWGKVPFCEVDLSSVPLTSRPKFEPGLYITLIADASHCPHTQAYGWCWWVKHGHPAKTDLGVGGGIRMRGSQQAEVEALRAGIEFLSQNMEKQLKGKRVVIQSDCTGALKAIEPEMERLRQLGAAMVYTKHVPGHRGHSTPRNSINTLCDRKAREQMLVWRHKANEPQPAARSSGFRP